MFKDVGSKLKLFALIWWFIGLTGGIVEFVLLSLNYDFSVIVRIVILLITIFAVHTFSLCLYGFGELIGTAKKIRSIAKKYFNKSLHKKSQHLDNVQ